MSRLLHKLRRRIEASRLSRYEIAKRAGLQQSQLSRLMSGERGLSVDALERLSEALDLDIVIRPKRRRRKAR
jgi:transcriptional regulator with XRE-family HTH domain